MPDPTRPTAAPRPPTDREADGDALGLILDMMEGTIIPVMLPRQQPVWLAACARARSLRALLLAGRVLVLEGEEVSRAS
ncbi:MAG: hypothetical protein AB7N76_09640 [Planctomycetota bacterium]